MENRSDRRTVDADFNDKFDKKVLLYLTLLAYERSNGRQTTFHMYFHPYAHIETLQAKGTPLLPVVADKTDDANMIGEGVNYDHILT